jgi:glycosyltransferase involved in cell wall biosynthesis
VPTYRTGAVFNRVVESLDAQTLPQDEFETIVIDDGSPDETFAMLQRHAAARPNMTVRRIERSGWPSRPRNVALEMARGEWVLFLDHDDSLYPDALRRGTEYATETHADVLSPKESKTSDVWWGMPALTGGNIPDARATHGIDVLTPMVPHKFYRRDLLLEHGIRFPEGGRMLWEDIYLNVAAWRHARHVAVLADTPVYLWHSSAENTSKTYGPRDEEFWDRLDDLCAFIDHTLDGPAFEEARRSTLLNQYRDRVLGRFSRMLQQAAPEETAMALARARRIQETYVPLEWEQHLGLYDRARAVLLRAERPDLMQRLAAIDGAVTLRADTERAEWVDGRLRLRLKAGLIERGAGPVAFRRDGERVRRILPADIEAALPPAVLDVTDRLQRCEFWVGTRDRADRVTWQLPHEPHLAFESLDEEGLATPVVRTTATLDLEHAALGAPLPNAVWDHYAAVRWEGHELSTTLRYTGPARAALAEGRAAVAYRSRRDGLAVDTSGRLRNVVKDSRPTADDVTGTTRGLVVALPDIAITGRTELPVAVVLIPDPDESDGPRPQLTGTVVGGPDGARLEATGTAPPGSYRVAFRVGEGEALVSGFVAHVDGTGGFSLTRPEGRQQPEAHPASGTVSRFWRSAIGAARTTAQRIRSRR